MDREMDENEAGPAALEAVDRALTAMDRAIVDDPEDALGASIGELAMTSLTSASKATIVDFSVTWPKSRALWTSQAAW